ncbi:DUF4400 domain-containing protein [Enterovibrio norvegicus]|uniref:DUF4400 domain-containing protein n=1 Tax=Enterovibrio norvegicus TaxID=188144 RepID=UPI000C83C92B|nr:DUF4400 domain-containing protein [Enterovibrio norvegicus]PMH64436.1 hypothetical protein BCU62_15390 [Enterovibrio norvegicus]
MAGESGARQDSSRQSGSSLNIPLISFYLKLIFKVLGISLKAGFICLCIEFVIFFVVDDPIEKSHGRYTAASQFVTGNWLDAESISTRIEKAFSEQVDVQQSKAYIEKITSVFSFHVKSVKSDSAIISSIIEDTGKVIQQIPSLFQLWIIVTFTWVAKFISILAMILPCTLILLGGLIDGSVERKINTYRGKRDSQDKIEWWFLLLKSSSYTVLFVYVAIPNTFQAITLMLPSAVISAFFLKNVAANYKKYW